MPILLTTFGLLLVISLIAVSQVTNSKNTALLTGISLKQHHLIRDSIQDTLSTRTIIQDRTNRPKKTEDPFSAEAEDERVAEANTPDQEQMDIDDNPDPKKPRCTSFLHVDALFCEDDPDLVGGKAKTAFVLMKAYIKELYKDQEFYQQAKEEYPDLEEQMIRKWIQEAQELRRRSPKRGKLRTAEELLILDLEDPALMYVRYSMFVGKSRTKKQKNSGDGYYSLSTCLSVKGSPKNVMSVWLAPRPLLMALFQNEEVVDQVLAWRSDTYHEITKDKSIETMKGKPGEFKSKFASYIDSSVQSEFIDWSVSHNRIALES